MKLNRSWAEATMKSWTLTVQRTFRIELCRNKACFFVMATEETIAKNSRHPQQCPNTIETPLSGVAERGMQTRYVQAKPMPKRSHWSAEHEQKHSKERSSGNVWPWLRLGRNCRRLATNEAYEFMKWIISRLWGARSRLYRHRAL